MSIFSDLSEVLYKCLSNETRSPLKLIFSQRYDFLMPNALHFGFFTVLTIFCLSILCFLYKKIEFLN